MKDLYIIGAGGFTMEVLFLIDRFYKKKWNNIYIIDDNSEKIGSKIRNVDVISNVNDFIVKCKNEGDIERDALVTINNPQIRNTIVALILKENIKINFPNLLDETLIFDEEYSKLGQGNIIMDFVGITGNVTIGDFNIIGARTGIGHDSSIGNFNTFSPRVSISGNVTIGNGNTFGLNSAILQNKSIGDNNNIWSYTMLLRNIKNNCTYFGMPAKKIQI
ncbi:serine acetyltransferase [Flavobacterium paronense]|uniref:Serine acetyltransferase n=1 Tax=Flavobacterium paronense TaxID=1392775 RepID=A0ABV5GFE1_9FLAO|nr:serine acetyltransferase [Flavobacterium paronense]MDN3676039.1 serine acetyltransferase [Flavobacterium paronense]